MTVCGIPTIRPVVIATGALYSHLTSYALTVPALQGVYERYNKFGSDAESTAKSTEGSAAIGAVSSALVSSVTQSWAVTVLLELAGAKSLKAAAIVGTLLFGVSTGSQLINAYFVDKKPLDIVAAKAGVSFFQTVGLSTFLYWSAGVHQFDTTY